MPALPPLPTKISLLPPLCVAIISAPMPFTAVSSVTSSPSRVVTRVGHKMHHVKRHEILRAGKALLHEPTGSAGPAIGVRPRLRRRDPQLRESACPGPLPRRRPAAEPGPRQRPSPQGLHRFEEDQDIPAARQRRAPLALLPVLQHVRAVPDRRELRGAPVHHSLGRLRMHVPRAAAEGAGDGLHGGGVWFHGAGAGVRMSHGPRGRRSGPPRGSAYPSKVWGGRPDAARPADRAVFRHVYPVECSGGLVASPAPHPMIAPTPPARLNGAP